MKLSPVPWQPRLVGEAPSESSLGHRPAAEKWEFDSSVAAVFPDMLRRSIPDYPGMRDAVRRLARRFAKDGTEIVDLGASLGDGVSELYDELGPLARWALVERSPAMLARLRERFAVGIEGGWVRALDLDLRDAYPETTGASLTLAVLTLQFVPVEHRQRILRRAFESTLPGGALIVVEKVLGSTASAQEAFVEEYHRLKVENGYSEGEVAAKAASLEGVLVPLSAEENVRTLRAEGFETCEFWRWLNFAGWLAVKPSPTGKPTK